MSEPVVETKQGFIQGCTKHDLLGEKLYAFLGIPFALPPVGSLRFKDPVPITKWKGIRDGSVEGAPCCQFDESTQRIVGSEDCLYLNVFTKELPENQKATLKPVMVWIHGGAFRHGSNTLAHFGPEFLMTEDIVLVTINYRLGLLGFLRLNDTKLNVNGNMGLKDQAQALRWVKDNIAYFSGDPGNVTIFGESAGAVSVHYHVLSPLSRDLFHKAIMQSGTALNSWGETDHNAVELAKLLDPSVKDENSALARLNEATPQKLYEISLNIKIGPVIEHPSPNAFITRRPIDIIKSGEHNQVPMMFGYTNREGLLFKTAKYETGKTFQIENLIPKETDHRSAKEIKQALTDLKDFYLNGSDTEDGLIKLVTDWQFVTDIIASIKNHINSLKEKIFVYKMTVDTRLNYYKKKSNLDRFYGACHADDLGYLFKSVFTPPIDELTNLESVSIKRFVKMWTNFAKYGSPTDEELGIEWVAVTPERLSVITIGEELKIDIDPESKQLELWARIYNFDPRTENYLCL